MTEEKISDWATHGMRERKFWKNGMTPEEYEIEDCYYHGHMYKGLPLDTYTPIWKQRLDDRHVKIVVDETWASPYMKGFDFWYSGMTLDEYEQKYREHFKNLN